MKWGEGTLKGKKIGIAGCKKAHIEHGDCLLQFRGDTGGEEGPSPARMDA